MSLETNASTTEDCRGSFNLSFVDTSLTRPLSAVRRFSVLGLGRWSSLPITIAGTGGTAYWRDSALRIGRSASKFLLATGRKSLHARLKHRPVFFRLSQINEYVTRLVLQRVPHICNGRILATVNQNLILVLT